MSSFLQLWNLFGNIITEFWNLLGVFMEIFTYLKLLEVGSLFTEVGLVF